MGMSIVAIVAGITAADEFLCFRKWSECDYGPFGFFVAPKAGWGGQLSIGNNGLKLEYPLLNLEGNSPIQN